MGYYCNICKKTISDRVFQYSMDKYDIALCYDHQNNYLPDSNSNNSFNKKSEHSSTPEARKLGLALKKRRVPVEFEKWDGYKHIDIAVVEARVNIEVDGAHHNVSHRQALADLKRTYHSFRKGYLTLRIPNSLVKNDDIIEETADYIVEFLNESLDQMEEY